MHEVVYTPCLVPRKAAYNGIWRMYASKCPKVRDITHKMLITHGRDVMGTPKNLYMYCNLLKHYIPLTSGTSEWVIWAEHAFRGCILLTRSLWTVTPESDWVAVHLLFCPETTMLSRLHAHLAHNKCSVRVIKVCFTYSTTYSFPVGPFFVSGGSKSPRLYILPPQPPV